MAKYTSVDEYMASLPGERRAVMEQMRSTIRGAAPDATEAIAYNMPAFRWGGKFLVSYEAYKRHYSLFPATDAVVAALREDIAPFLSGRGTIRFPADASIPVKLVRRIVAIRLGENAERAARR